jgi:hypothetical protein
VLPVARPEPAFAAAASGWGYAWAHDPSASSYTPSRAYQFNSGGAVNTISRSGVGAYTVSFPDLGGPGGTVLVTAYGDGAEICKVANWTWAGTAEQVNVRCFSRDGAPADTRYVLSFARPQGTARPMGYL